MCTSRAQQSYRTSQNNRKTKKHHWQIKDKIMEKFKGSLGFKAASLKKKKTEWKKNGKSLVQLQNLQGQMTCCWWTVSFAVSQTFELSLWLGMAHRWSWRASKEELWLAERGLRAQQPTGSGRRSRLEPPPQSASLDLEQLSLISPLINSTSLCGFWSETKVSTQGL